MLAVEAGQATIFVAVIGACGAVLVGVFTAAVQAFTIVAKRREAKDPMTVAWITAGQESLLAALKERDEREERIRVATEAREVQHARDIDDLRAQVAQMRLELADALQHAKDCDEQRIIQDAEIRLLRERLDGIAP